VQAARPGRGCASRQAPARLPERQGRGAAARAADRGREQALEAFGAWLRVAAGSPQLDGAALAAHPLTSAALAGLQARAPRRAPPLGLCLPPRRRRPAEPRAVPARSDAASPRRRELGLGRRGGRARATGVGDV